MKSLEWKTIDKSTWGPGPWQDEPDKMQFTDEASGLPCLIVRNQFGALCGYVGVPEGHTFYGLSYDEIHDAQDIGVHRGLTFANHCTLNTNPATGICHLVEPGEPDNVWWLGFDCAHSGDLSPGLPELNFDGDEYRTIEYVKEEIRSLAQQLIKKHGTGLTNTLKPE